MKKKTEQRINDKGFSLVEMIIVIAIMGILVGVVGTQVVPYMERSGEAKDQQLLSSVATAVTSAIAMNGKSVEEIPIIKLVDLKTAEKGKFADLADQVAELLLPEDAASKTVAAAQDYIANNFTSKKAKEDNTIYLRYLPEKGKLFVYLTEDDTKDITVDDKNKATVPEEIFLYVESN